MKKIAILPSGGRGSRVGGNIPKQYIKVNNKEIIAYTLEIFQTCPQITDIIVAAEDMYFPLLNEIKEKYNITKLTKIVKGGSTRQDSVYNALCASGAEAGDIVAVHDAARPLLPQDVLSNVLQLTERNNSSVVAVKAKDTLIVGDNTVEKYADRSKIYYAQTPQLFRYSILKDAMDKASEQNFIGTDESMLVKRAGYEVNIVEGSSFNFKITTPSDLELFTFISKRI